METTLMIVTACSMAVALGAAWLTWRVRSREHERQLARVAALSAAIHGVEPPMAGEPESTGLELPTTSVLGPWVGVAAGADLRVLPPRYAQAAGDISSVAGPALAPVAVGSMFSTTRDEGFGASFLTVRHAIAGGAVAGALLLAAILVSAGGQAAVDTPASSPAPLELLALRHDQQDGGVRVSGVVRNPDLAQPLRHLAAVVVFFDQRGGLVGSSRAPVDFTTLAPGEESPFTVAVNPAPPLATRYRVSFRRDGAGVLPHVDRREKS